jgi:hypothetical protein
MSVVLEQEQGRLEEIGADEQGADEGVQEEVVTLSIKKTYPAELVEAIAAANDGVTILEKETSYQLSGPVIRVVRSQVAKVVGDLSDSKWRVLFMNRSGQVSEFDNSQFVLGIPKSVPIEELEQKETSQLNVRIEKTLKAEMEFFRALLPNVNQNEFVAEALREYVCSLREEMV